MYLLFRSTSSSGLKPLILRKMKIVSVGIRMVKQYTTPNTINLYCNGMMRRYENINRTRNARKIKEVVTDGHIQSGYYQLPPVKDKINRFILFRLGKKGEATLIYIEGEIDSDDLVTLIFSKD